MVIEKKSCIQNALGRLAKRMSVIDISHKEIVTESILPILTAFARLTP